SSRRRHTRCLSDWSSDVCSSDLCRAFALVDCMKPGKITHTLAALLSSITSLFAHGTVTKAEPTKTKFSKKSEKKSDESRIGIESDRKSTRLNSSHLGISYAVFCL